MGYANDTLQVIKLQAFLKAYEHFDYVTVNGVFDQATYQAVSAFQLRYKDDILSPWGIDTSTGYAYIRTVGKINQVICGQAIPGVPYTSPYHIVKAKPPAPKPVVAPCSCPCTCQVRQEIDSGTSTVSATVRGGQISDKGHPPDWKTLWAALWGLPYNGREVLVRFYWLLLILLVLYLLYRGVKSVLYEGWASKPKEKDSLLPLVDEKKGTQETGDKG